MVIIFIAIVSLLCFLYVIFKGLKQLKKTANTIELTIATIYIFSLLLFALGMLTHSNPYYKAINPVDNECYSPFSVEHTLTLLVYFFAFNISMLIVWVKRNNVPPLALVLSMVFILIGIIFNIAILFQISEHDTTGLTYNSHRVEQVLFMFAPLFSMIIGLWLIIQVVRQETIATYERTYRNKYLNYLNVFLAFKSRNPIWILIFLFPVFLIVTIILILFGQDVNSVVKIFTDTTTWKLSQQMHPPILDHRGHYLCTVAASGDPRIVKPIRFGQRNGSRIIVNRQLLIANAFEEMLQDYSPKLHQIIRKFYDKYGFNVSKKI
ncbi:MAG: DUF6688 domain-containing protein, partial [Nitrososphaeraceae archaeon]